jgi:hypothetical protein
MDRFRVGNKMPKRRKDESEADYIKRVKKYMHSIRPKRPEKKEGE